MSEEKILMPKELTAENGAKGLLSGEFKEGFTIACPHCYSDSDEDCEECGGMGEIDDWTSVSWTTIKEIYAKCVEHFESKGE